MNILMLHATTVGGRMCRSSIWKDTVMRKPFFVTTTALTLAAEMAVLVPAMVPMVPVVPGLFNWHRQPYWRRRQSE
jgi:hypothetical protein